MARGTVSVAVWGKKVRLKNGRIKKRETPHLIFARTEESRGTERGRGCKGWYATA